MSAEPPEEISLEAFLFMNYRTQKILLSFMVLLILPFLGCGTGGDEGSISTGFVTLTWDSPTTNADGTPLEDLAGYKIYYGISEGNYTASMDAGNVTTYTVSNLSSGTYYFAVIAYDISGNESDYSNEVSKIIQ